MNVLRVHLNDIYELIEGSSGAGLRILEKLDPKMTLKEKSPKR